MLGLLHMALPYEEGRQYGMLGNMNLEGIGAISAAAVAALGVSAAVLVGRWQMRGALRAAEETGRAGIAQAESTYRAALDAVRTAADAAHLQWRRGIRRDAYAGFLLAMTRCVQAAEALPRGRLEAAQVLTTAEDELTRAKNDLSAALWVVKLEGPPLVADSAGSVSSLACELTEVLSRKAEYYRAASTLRHLSSSNPVAAELDAALMRLAVVVSETGYNARPGSRQLPPQEVTEAVERATELHDQLSEDIGIYEWVVLLNEALDYFADPESLNRQLSATVEQFLPACRQALDAPHSTDDPSVTTGL
ncbi:hypothetical protein QFZ55_002937 [Streptomyces luteogriseus]|uniref:hypothetical protein n=1 Tax=Streptomyces luteogriseus TaxID=68233 RepID=UPI00278A6CB3|nr:hypothetical protein [Streptomyces luteogriseus]MDQ0713485.1 hypothetical protein [Streptomyces luteogriseus]